MTIYKGGIRCGEARYEVTGSPEISAICHCRYCQLRTGSAFGVFVYLDESKFSIKSGKLNLFEFESESGNNWETNFCSACAPQ
ncbi:MAG: GFA family protein [Pseudomonadota bacterium]|nr:GFA family protein [Pseudomonadota bacterium]